MKVWCMGCSVPQWRFTLFFLTQCSHTNFAVRINVSQAASKAKYNVFLSCGLHGFEKGRRVLSYSYVRIFSCQCFQKAVDLCCNKQRFCACVWKDGILGTSMMIAMTFVGSSSVDRVLEALFDQ